MTTIREFYVKQPKVGDLIRRHVLDPEYDIRTPYRVVNVHRYGRKLDVITWGSTEPITIERPSWGSWPRYFGQGVVDVLEGTTYWVHPDLMTSVPPNCALNVQWYDLAGDYFCGSVYGFKGYEQTSFDRSELLDADGNVPPVPERVGAML